MALSSVGFMITISELLPDAATVRAPPLPLAAYGGERQRFNQLHCWRQIICVAQPFKGHIKSSCNAYLPARVCGFWGCFWSPGGVVVRGFLIETTFSLLQQVLHKFVECPPPPEL